MYKFKLDDDFMLGVASAATQIEGGDKNNSWYDWYTKGKILDGSNPDIANEHYIRYEEDIRTMASLGIQTYRFGIEWSKIEPENGKFDEEVLKHYREEVLLMKELGITPLLTLHHFTNPMWFEKMGAFENDNCVKIFLRFTLKVLSCLGDLIDEYITINEPNVYTVNGLFFGSWPPGKKSFASVQKAYKNFTRCHIAAYHAIHEMRAELGFYGTKVGVAMHMRVFDPESKKNLKHISSAKFTEKCFQTSIMRSMATGVVNFPVGNSRDIVKGKYYDFIGINYYTRSTVSGIDDGVKANAPVNDLGWEIYPEGLVRCVKKLYDEYEADIYITENGTCDNEDKFRSRYMYEHLEAIAKSGLPVKRYYHWCYTDNFEWLEGESARFGIVHCDYKTQERTVKKSGKFYSEIIANKGVTEEMYNAYCIEEYNLNNGVKNE